ncbi:Tdh Threonine dehydrogenase and related Zn-dependent dehydrogenases [actinobacterium SCGC AAA044-D11]
MKAFVVTAPNTFEIQDVAEPKAGAGEIVAQVERVGVCGTDVEFFNGSMPYLQDGQAQFPIRIGHEWSGTVIEIGAGVDSSLLGKKIISDVMMGCGNCKRCQDGRQHTCADRYELGIRNGFAGALAEKLLIPARFAYVLPNDFDFELGALVEPAANAWRVADAAKALPGKQILIWGTGTVGLLTAQFCLAMGADVHMVGIDPKTIKLALEIGVTSAGTEVIKIAGGYDTVIDATFDSTIPAKLIDIVEPGGRVVLIGVDNHAAPIDSRKLVFKDVTVVGILSASPGLRESIRYIAEGKIDVMKILGGTVGMSEAGDIFQGKRPADMGVGPKVLVNPRG